MGRGFDTTYQAVPCWHPPAGPPRAIGPRTRKQPMATRVDFDPSNAASPHETGSRFNADCINKAIQLADMSASDPATVKMFTDGVASVHELRITVNSGRITGQPPLTLFDIVEKDQYWTDGKLGNKERLLAAYFLRGCIAIFHADQNREADLLQLCERLAEPSSTATHKTATSTHTGEFGDAGHLEDLAPPHEPAPGWTMDLMPRGPLTPRRGPLGAPGTE